MFTRKTTKKKVLVPSVETRTITVPTAHGIKEAVVPAVVGAAALAKSYTHEASDWAKPHLEQVSDLASTQASKAQDRVAELKDNMGDSAKLSALVASGAAAKDEAARRTQDAALVLQGKAVVKRKKEKGGFGKLVLNLGLLTALGAVAALVAQKFTQPKDDPWARPLTDPYVAPPAGRDTTVAAGEGVKVTEVKEGDVQGADVTDKAGTSEIIVPAGQVRTEGDQA